MAIAATNRFPRKFPIEFCFFFYVFLQLTVEPRIHLDTNLVTVDAVLLCNMPFSSYHYGYAENNVMFCLFNEIFTRNINRNSTISVG